MGVTPINRLGHISLSAPGDGLAGLWGAGKALRFGRGARGVAPPTDCECDAEADLPFPRSCPAALGVGETPFAIARSRLFEL